MTLTELRKYAMPLGVKIEAYKDCFGWGYWLVDRQTGDGLWGDDNFCASLEEVEHELYTYEKELA